MLLSPAMVSFLTGYLSLPTDTLYSLPNNDLWTQNREVCLPLCRLGELSGAWCVFSWDCRVL